ncbi:MAG: lactonase family protein [Candidatus Accumulibacter sp.]|jgi:6-phosphogluconolactonase|nr:lactonase family protein [Accumulibacter sp.]
MTQTFIYVSCAGSREVVGVSLDVATGGVVLRQRVGVEGNPTPLRVSPDGRLLLVGLRGESALMTCAIGPADGRLSVLGRVSSPGAPAFVNCDAAGRTAFMASYPDNLLAVFPLDSAGRPGAAAQVEENLPRAHAALVDASGRWLLAPTLGADAIRVYRISAGRIAPGAPPFVAVRPGSGPRHLVLSADNRRAYCLNELDGTIDRFSFDADAGALRLEESVNMLPPGFAGKPWAAELRASPGEAFLYASERRSSTVAWFAVEPGSGRLSPGGHVEVEAQPRGMAVDPSGRWLAVAGELSGHLAIFALDPASGRPAPHARIEVGAGPICVEIAAFAP